MICPGGVAVATISTGLEDTEVVLRCSSTVCLTFPKRWQPPRRKDVNETVHVQWEIFTRAAQGFVPVTTAQPRLDEQRRAEILGLLPNIRELRHLDSC